MAKKWSQSEKLANGISIAQEVGADWLATIIFQREQFSARGRTKDEAIEKLREHLKTLVDTKVWEWKVQHEQNILNDLLSWVGQHAVQKTDSTYSI